MTPSDLAARLRAMTLAVSPLAAIPEVSADSPPHYSPGQRLIAQIIAPLADGTYRASVDGRTVRIALDQPAQPGDRLELEVTGHQDKSVLTQRVTVATRDATAALPTRADPAAAANAQRSAAVTTLSSAGQRIADALSFRGGEGTPRVGSMPPALPANAIDPAQIATTLARALSRSGVFYEAHQARWVEGSMPLSELMQEPQAGMSTRAQTIPLAQPQANASAADAAAAARAAHPDGPTALRAVPDQALPARAATTGAEPQRTAHDVLAGAADPAAPRASHAGGSEMAPELRPLVQQQLNALSQHQVTLQMPLWPGVDMQLDIHDPDRADEDSTGRRNAADGNDAPPWRSRLRLHLPQLGDISATLELRASHLMLNLQAGPATAARLAAGSADLQRALEAGGLNLDAMQIGTAS